MSTDHFYILTFLKVLPQNLRHRSARQVTHPCLPSCVTAVSSILQLYASSWNVHVVNNLIKIQNWESTGKTSKVCTILECWTIIIVCSSDELLVLVYSCLLETLQVLFLYELDDWINFPLNEGGLSVSCWSSLMISWVCCNTHDTHGQGHGSQDGSPLTRNYYTWRRKRKKIFNPEY